MPSFELSPRMCLRLRRRTDAVQDSCERKDYVGIATAYHVIDYADEWLDPIAFATINPGKQCCLKRESVSFLAAAKMIQPLF